MALTEKQKRFCDEYLIDLNATQAAIRAGYSKKNARNIASENLAKPNIKKYIELRLEEKEAALIANQNEVLETLTRILRREESETIVVTCRKKESGYNEKGQRIDTLVEEPKTVEIPTKVSDVVKAANTLAKYYGILEGETSTQNVSEEWIEAVLGEENE